MDISEQEKNRIKGLHRKHSIINEQSSPAHDKLMDEITKWCMANNDKTGIMEKSENEDLFNAMGDYCVETISL